MGDKMPFLGWLASGLASFVVGLVYEKATNKEVVTSDKGFNLSWWDKTLLVVLGLGAFYIVKRVK